MARTIVGRANMKTINEAMNSLRNYRNGKGLSDADALAISNMLAACGHIVRQAGNADPSEPVTFTPDEIETSRQLMEGRM